MEIKLTWWFLYEWGKPTRLKPHQVILKSPFPRIHYYQNRRLQVRESQYLIPTYSWTFTPIPNWTPSVVTISPFNARIPVHDLITNFRRMLAVKFFSSSHDEDHETPWSQNPTVHKHSSFFKRKMNLGKVFSVHNLHKQDFASQLWNLYNLWWPLK